MNQFHDEFRTIQNYWNTEEWLRNRMLFLSGPRQVGKTTLVTHSLCPDKAGYFNWDERKTRLAYQKNPDFFSEVLSRWICFDEIHKRPKWKDILKGIYDGHKDKFRFVITGSARLDTFKKSGDSLVGRYFHTQLFPINLPDLHKNNFEQVDNPIELILQAADLSDSPFLEDLLTLGGFPEPFYSGSKNFWKRWHENHKDLILTEDLKDLTRVMEIDKIEALLEMLTPAIGSTISHNSLSHDLETTHGSIKRWLEALNKVELVFPITPYSKNIRRAFKQEKKWYFVDWCGAENNIFENFVAASLLRAVTLYSDRYGDKMSLHFIRTHDGTEVDFLLVKNKKPWLLIEAKEGAPDISSAMYRFAAELKVPSIVVTKQENIFKKVIGKDGQEIFCISWAKLGQVLP